MPDQNRDVPGQRRVIGGARHETSERVVLRHEGFVADGWAINESRGGIRVVLELPVSVGKEYLVTLGEDSSGAVGPERRARVIWVKEENDGQIAGLQFVDLEETPKERP